MRKPLRVAHIIQAYLPLGGGAERLVATLAPLLRRQDVEIVVLTRRYAGLAPLETIDSVPVHRLPIPGPKPMAALSFTLAALPLLQRLRPDVIHAHELLSPATIAVAAKRLLGGIPIVAMPHRGGYLGDIDKLQQRSLGQQRLALLRRHVDAFVTISREIDAELEGVGIPPRQRVSIPNGVDTRRFVPLPAADRQTLRRQLGLPQAPVAIFTGRLVAEKCIDQLIAVWPAVRVAHPDACLLLLGTGPQEETLRQAASAGIRFTGRVEDVVPFLQAADLFVLPSATEGLSVALLEAMAAGLAPVATAVGGTPDLIEHGRNGWLIPAGDPAALQNAILTLFADRQQRQQMSQRGRQQVVREYALPVVAQRLRTLYDQLIAGRSATASRPLESIP